MDTLEVEITELPPDEEEEKVEVEAIIEPEPEPEIISEPVAAPVPPRAPIPPVPRPENIQRRNIPRFSTMR